MSPAITMQPPRLVHSLGAALPAGHLHVWGGPSGAGKRSLLLALVHGAARRGRRVVYATYDLAPESLALRMLAMCADVSLDTIPDPRSPAAAQPPLADIGAALSSDALRRLHAARSALAPLPFEVLAARGLGVESLADRLARCPQRPGILVVDYVQAVVGTPKQDRGETLRALSEMAGRMHLGVLCVFRPGTTTPQPRPTLDESVTNVADRVGWLAPGTTASSRQAEIVSNRHGGLPILSLDIDPDTGCVSRPKKS